MATVSAPTEAHFTWTAPELASARQVDYPIAIPNRLRVEELVALICKHFSLPPSVEPQLSDALDEFLHRETAAHHARLFEADLASLAAGGDEMLDQMVDFWESAYAEGEPGAGAGGAGSVTPQNYVSDELLFAHAYHNLIHSNALQALLNLEQQYSRVVAELIDDRDREMENLERQQESEMGVAIAQVGSRYSDDEISRLAQRQWEDKQLREARWASELEHMRIGHRREYRDFVLSVHERTETMEEDLRDFIRPPMGEDFESADGADDSASGEWEAGAGAGAEVGATPWEESFTIVLGKQLKTSHHFRLLRADILDFCRARRGSSAQRLNTAMSLYSDQLSGLVLLVDNRLNTFSGIKRDFARVCERATEFHFPELNEQFERISLVLQSANERRAATAAAAATNGAISKVKSLPSMDSDLSSCQADEASSLRSWTSYDSSPRLQVGDVYITRHSNLTDAHVVFHLVADESIYDASLTSTSPVVRGLTNIFRACFQHDVIKLTLPLLLAHHTSEEMTAAWCTRRVDMVYKAVKAGVIEGTTWMSRESRLVQFAVPLGISDEMLESFRDQLPSVFHLANPVKG